MTIMSEPGIVRQLMIATIVDTKFLKGMRSVWREELAGTTWRWVYSRCSKYLDEYGKSPGKNIQSIWASEITDPNISKDLDSILSELSEEYENLGDINSDMLLKEARKYFALELLLKETAEIEAAAESGDIVRAEEILKSVRIPELETQTSIDISSNPDLIKEAFTRKPIPLVSLKGDFQSLVGNQITKDSFVAFVGKEKVGKTWILQSIAFAGVKAGSNVLFCQCGDLSLSQQIVRMSIQLTGRSNKPKYNRSIRMPVLDCQMNQDGTCERPERKSAGSIIEENSKPYPKFFKFSDIPNEYTPCTECPDIVKSSWFEILPTCKELEWEEAYKAWRKFDKVTRGSLRIEWFPNKIATISSIRSKIDQLEDDGWKADIIIIDYLDIFASQSSGDFRHGEDSKWASARRLSQDKECSIVTATQANREGYNKRVLGQHHTSEDKRKAAHVTAMFGLNKDEHDIRRGWIRVNPLFVRDDSFSIYEQVAVLQLLERGAPNLGSFWYVKGEE